MKSEEAAGRVHVKFLEQAWKFFKHTWKFLETQNSVEILVAAEEISWEQ